MKAILFASAFTLLIGYLYRVIEKRLTVRQIESLGDKPTSQEIRQSPEYRQWSSAVKKRDDYRCVWCKSTDNLEAHHIYSFASFPEMRFDIKNGMTLCSRCHKLTPNYGSKEKVFSKQIKSIPSG